MSISASRTGSSMLPSSSSSSTTTTTLLLMTLVGLAMVEAKSDSGSALQSASQLMSAPFTACIDGGDCSGLGSGYACFQYICYPWADDHTVPVQHRKKTCSSKEDCDQGEICFRHYDRRVIHKGLCMRESRDCSEHREKDCPEKCCNGQFCCEEEYFNQLKSLPCVNHGSCRDLGYGKYCCPSKVNGTAATCCDVNPNPPPPTKSPSTRPVSSDGWKTAQGAFSVFAVMMAVLTLGKLF